jgi:hypothetical protein
MQFSRELTRMTRMGGLGFELAADSGDFFAADLR